MSTSGSGRLTRRALGRTAVSAAAFIAAGAGLSSSAAARTQRGAGKIKILLQVSWQGGTNYQGEVQSLTDAFLQKNWVSAHPGVELTTQAGSGSNGNSVTDAGTIAAVLAGEGPDILVTCCEGVPDYVTAGVLAPLDPWLRRDNITTALFPASVMDVLTIDNSVFGLPDYGSTGPFFVNLSMLDELGLAYPQPDWTYQDAEKLWRAVAGTRGGKQVSGAGVVFASANSVWLPRGWGGPVYDATHSRCLLNNPRSMAAFEWLVPLMAEKVVLPQVAGATPIKNGQVAFSVGCCGTLQSAATTLGNSIKWDIFPMPRFPAGSTNFDGIGMYGMNRFSKNPPDLLWDLLKFVTVDARWQQFFNAQLAFMPPNSASPAAWDDWLRIVRAVAPPLRDKHLEYYQQALPGAYNRAYFRYAPLEADAIWAKYSKQMVAGQITAVEGVNQIATEINALEAAAATEATAEGRALEKVKSALATAAATSADVTFAQPSRAGIGTPPKPAGALVSAKGQTFSVTGTGTMAGGVADSGTFACAADRNSRAVYSCRLTAIEALQGQTLQGGAKVGLMIRGDLSNNAPMVALDIDGPNGMHIDDRPLPGITQDHQHSDGVGLPNGSTLVKSSGTPIPNWLVQPVWMKWERADATWTAYSSLDGKTWKQAGVPVTGIEMAACWVGLFVTSNNAPHDVRATFDHLTGFLPDTFVALGG